MEGCQVTALGRRDGNRFAVSCSRPTGLEGHRIDREGRRISAVGDDDRLRAAAAVGSCLAVLFGNCREHDSTVVDQGSSAPAERSSMAAPLRNAISTQRESQ